MKMWCDLHPKYKIFYYGFFWKIAYHFSTLTWQRIWLHLLDSIDFIHFICDKFFRVKNDAIFAPIQSAGKTQTSKMVCSSGWWSYQLEKSFPVKDGIPIIRFIITGRKTSLWPACRSVGRLVGWSVCRSVCLSVMIS